MQDEIIVGIVSGIVFTLFGWTLSQMTIGKSIAKVLATQDLKIQSNENEVNRLKDNLAMHRTETTQQIISMASLVEKVLGTADKLIGVVTIQNALLSERVK